MATQRPEAHVAEDPHAQMERAYMEAFLRERGHNLKCLRGLPEVAARQLMTEASRYASSRLSEIEARAHFVEEVHGVAPPV